MTHTPGPWKVRQGTSEYRSIYARWPNHPDNAENPDWFPWHVASVHGQTREEREANAHLMAAAPNILKALPDPDKLEILADWFDLKQEEAPERWPSGSAEVQDDLRRWAQDARAAIAEANGETPSRTEAPAGEPARSAK